MTTASHIQAHNVELQKYNKEKNIFFGSNLSTVWDFNLDNFIVQLESDGELDKVVFFDYEQMRINPCKSFAEMLIRSLYVLCENQKSINFPTLDKIFKDKFFEKISEADKIKFISHVKFAIEKMDFKEMGLALDHFKIAVMLVQSDPIKLTLVSSLFLSKKTNIPDTISDTLCHKSSNHDNLSRLTNL